MFFILAVRKLHLTLYRHARHKVKLRPESEAAKCPKDARLGLMIPAQLAFTTPENAGLATNEHADCWKGEKQPNNGSAVSSPLTERGRVRLLAKSLN